MTKNITMFISSRAAKLRNLSVASVNGSVTLIILLIAPLGLAAVIINTLLVTIASYGVSQMADKVVIWLSPPIITADLINHHRRRNNDKLANKKL